MQDKSGAPGGSEADIPTLPDEDVESIAEGDETAGRFFSDAPVAFTPHAAVFDEPAPLPPAVRSPAQDERRQRLKRYVAFAVVASGALCVAAAIHGTSSSREAASRRDPSPAPGPPPVALAAAIPSTTTGDPRPTPEPAPPPDNAPPPAIVVASEISDDQQAAAEAKGDAQQALDHGRLSRSIESGERSVALDATDAEAWLVLGAAYIQRGAYAKARECFTSCVQSATRGPRDECAALLR
jgi:hypothetical protein